MNFHIDSAVFARFQGLKIGVLHAEGIAVSGTPRRVHEMTQSLQQDLRRMYTPETLSKHPRINIWRQAYSAFGAKPKKYKCSVENLTRMVLKGIDLKPINPIVDITNYVSLKHMIPMGGDDLDKVEGDIRLTFAEGTETFKPLHSDEIASPKEGEMIYRDDEDVLCRRWNWRESDKTKMTGETKNILLVAEGLPPVNHNDIGDLLSELKHLVQEFCGGTLATGILDEKTPCYALPGKEGI